MSIFEKYKMLQPMKYFDKDADNLSPTLKVRRDAMIDNLKNQYIATKKNDGEWGMFIKGENGEILIRSRSIGVSGEYGKFTEKLPHLVKEMETWPLGTVVLGEICFPSDNSTSRDVGAILRCLPEKAIERQKEKKLMVKVFDLLVWTGVEQLNIPYEIRLSMAKEFFRENRFDYFSMTEIYETGNFAAIADQIIERGGEGLVIQLRTNPYLNQTKSATAWKSLKLKQTMPLMELKILGTVDANLQYNGDLIESWKYWKNPDGTLQELKDTESPVEGSIAVTKPYFFGRKVGVVVDFNGVSVNVTSGCTEELGDYLATQEAADLIAQGKLWAQVKAMMVSATGESLRHPRLIDVRILDAEGE